jgi:radical SAM protein with 4Fe4S-binding SPASM domain
MNWTFYLKTTETCNLNCSHCFTSGINGAKVYWNTTKIIDWLHRFRKHHPKTADTAHCEFHGGEPFLVPVAQMRTVWEECKHLWGDQMSWGVTTNLVFKMYDEHIDFIKGPLGNRIGTSWDPKIRFANKKQYLLWHSNIKRLLAEGVTIRLFISVTKDTIAYEPITLLRWIRILGVHEVSFERLTNNGSARKFPNIFPTNVELDEWFYRMHMQSEEAGARGWFENDFLENVYRKFENGNTKCGTFCRDCEEKLFTLNADGTISGCPNAAQEQQFGNIDDDIEKLVKSPQRIINMLEERSRNKLCYVCPVFQYCGGDCHQLEWQENVCGAPKSLMIHLANQRD